MYKKACILVAHGVQDEEFIYPYYRLKEDFDLDVIFVSTPKYDKPVGKYGIPFSPNIILQEEFQLEIYLNNFIKKYDIFIVPGGWQAPEIMRMNENVKFILDKAYEAGKIIGAICHGPQVLISSSVGKGKCMTAFKGIKDDIINFGANWVDSPVVTDSNLVTAQHYKDNHHFMKEVLNQYYNNYVPKHYQG